MEAFDYSNEGCSNYFMKYNPIVNMKATNAMNLNLNYSSGYSNTIGYLSSGCLFDFLFGFTGFLEMCYLFDYFGFEIGLYSSVSNGLNVGFDTGCECCCCGFPSLISDCY